MQARPQDGAAASNPFSVTAPTLWEKLGAGGEYSRCGWLKDRYGLSWQIVPSRLPELLSGHDPAGAMRAMEAMLKMSKLDRATRSGI
jgi:predicted 3-demethylubiquinone-9 3-methyltransferase (glyoxalase superfamily)